MNWQLIENCNDLDDLLTRHADCEAVMVDTEFMRLAEPPDEVTPAPVCPIGPREV